jgi:hypothetical protein
MSGDTLARQRWQATIVAFIVLGVRLVFPSWGMTLAASVAVLVASLAWFCPRWYSPVRSGFDRLGRVVLVFVTWVLLGGVYFGVFVPMRLWRALLRKDPLQRQWQSSAVSYLQPVRPAAPEHFRRQF